MSGINTKKFELILTKTYRLNERMLHLEFKLLNNEPLHYLAGQFISLLIENRSEIIRRNFSIANPPTNTNKLEIAATFVPNGIASTTLWNMQIGDHINASGPFGIFVLKPEEFTGIKRCILVATGTGVTPYRAMLGSIKKLLSNQTIEFILLLGVRNFNELLYAEDFMQLSDLDPNFKFIACYSREASTAQPQPSLQETCCMRKGLRAASYVPAAKEYTKGEHLPTEDPNDPSNVINYNNNIRPSNEYLGYVQNKLTDLNIQQQTDLIYLCGNPNMIDESMAILEACNISRNKIKREKYRSSK